MLCRPPLTVTTHPPVDHLGAPAEEAAPVEEVKAPTPPPPPGNASPLPVFVCLY